MTTARDVKRLLSPHLGQGSSWVLCGRMLVLPPVRHILRGVYIDATSSNNVFKPISIVQPLCQPEIVGILGYAEWLYRSVRGLWDDTIPGIGAEVMEQAQAQADRRLTFLDNLDDFYAWSTNRASQRIRILSDDPVKHMCVEVALGHLSQAREVCERLLHREGQLRKNGFEYWVETAALLYPLIVADDRAALAAKLRSWEAKAAKGWKLEALWRPSPFPLEERA